MNDYLIVFRFVVSVTAPVVLNFVFIWKNAIVSIPFRVNLYDFVDCIDLREQCICGARLHWRMATFFR